MRLRIQRILVLPLYEIVLFFRNTTQFWKLDSWEDDARRRRRLVPDARGSRHAAAALGRGPSDPPPHDAILQVHTNYFLYKINTYLLYKKQRLL